MAGGLHCVTRFRDATGRDFSDAVSHVHRLCAEQLIPWRFLSCRATFELNTINIKTK